MNLFLTLRITLFVGCVVFGFLVYKKTSAKLLMFLFGAYLASSYAVIAFSTDTMFWGLAGDEVFVASLFEHQAHGAWLADLNYAHLPIFYPPLYFVIGGLVGRLFDLDGIATAKAMTALVFLFAPILFYWFQKKYWNKQNLRTLYVALSTVLFFIVLPWDSLILKPYEFISAVMAVLLFSFFFHRLQTGEKLLDSKRSILCYGTISGLTFLTFYFWFIPVAIAIVLYMIFEKNRIATVKQSALICVLTLLISSPYWITNTISVIRAGYQNWQPLHFVASDFDIFFPYFTSLTPLAMVSGVGLIGLVWLRNNPYVRGLIYLWAAGYIYQLINYIIYTQGGKPMQASKVFLFFTTATLVLSAVWTLKEVLKKVEMRESSARALLVVATIAILFFTINGAFLNQSAIRDQIKANRESEISYQDMIRTINSIPSLNSITWLSSGYAELQARIPMYYFIAQNQHVSHPAGQYAQRREVLHQLSQAKNSEEFYALLKSNPVEPIDGLVLYRDEDNHYVFLWVDSYPNGGREEVVEIPNGIIDYSLYTVVYDDGENVVLLRK